MRQIHKLLGTGCFFLCLGGWGYNAQVIADDQAKETALNAAVAAAAAPGATEQPAAAPTTAPAPVAVAQAAPAPAPTPAAAPAAAPAKPDKAPADGAGTSVSAPVLNVSADGTVDFEAPDLDVNTALYLLSLQTKRNIVASKEVKGTVTAHLHNVTFAEALDALLKPNGFGYMEKGNFIYVYTEKELKDIKDKDRKTFSRMFRLKYIQAVDASVLVKPLLSPTAQMSLTPPAVIGVPEGTTDTGGNAYATSDLLVINDYPENLADVEKTFKELDVRPKQVLIESTILSASLQEDNALGVDFMSLSGIDMATLTGASATSNVLGAVDGLAGQTVPAVKTNQTNIGTDFTNKVPQGGLSVGFLSNNVTVFIRALEETTDITVVANPKILALNKHRGEVFIGDSIGYKTTQQSQTSTVETVQFLDTGTKLLFRPFITDDGYVRLEVHPEDSSPRMDNGLPGKTSTEVTSNLMVKDGRTVVIGGLFREQLTAGRGQVPVLGNIPVLGLPFRRTNDSTQRKETIVLITPHIINDDTALYDESEKKAQDITRMRMGARAMLMPWGRDRIAQLWYSKALEAQECGQKDKALMYTDWALNSSDRFLEAIKLRENLTQKKVQEADQSSIHTFVRDVIRNDAATIPNLGGPGHYPAPTTQP